MREILLSPGVLAKETDKSFITQLPQSVGAAIIGPTVNGKVGIPKLVTSYSEYVETYGETFISASSVLSYLTSISAYNYFSNGGNSLLVTRVQSGSWSPATSSIYNSTTSLIGSTGSAQLVTNATFGTSSLDYITVKSNISILPSFTLYAAVGTDDIANGLLYVSATSSNAVFLASSSLKINTLFNTVYTSSVTGNTLNFSTIQTGSLLNNITVSYGKPNVIYNTIFVSNANDFRYNGQCFDVEFLNDGVVGNNNGLESENGSLVLGTENNVRVEISNVDNTNGTFTLYVRSGNDTTKNKSILESFPGLSLDPLNENYIEKVIGNQIEVYNQVSKSIDISGIYPVSSKYIRIKQVYTPIPNYIDNLGNINFNNYPKLPVVQTTKFGGAIGNYFSTGTLNMFENISGQTQGLNASDYTNAINLMSNKDDYRFNIISTPGLAHNIPSHTSTIDLLISIIENRGDSIYPVDLTAYGASISQVVTEAKTIDSSYAAAYYPWLQVNNANTGQLVYVPASTVISGVYSFTDKISEPWYAPAGINRGGLSTVQRAEKKLSNSDRDTLYVGKVNPIATFPGYGVVVYGQKTLQTKPSALGKVNVRRMMGEIKVKISDIANSLVFEQNTIATRNSFLRQANPYLENVQQKQGLYAYKIIMDDTINTSDVIDRNQLVGKVYLQPTKTAEYIILDFTLTQTGASFN